MPVQVGAFTDVPATTLFAGLSGDISRLSLVVDGIDSGVRVGAYAAIIDNVSGDATSSRRGRSMILIRPGSRRPVTFHGREVRGRLTSRCRTSDETATYSFSNLSKVYRLYSAPRDRLVEALSGRTRHVEVHALRGVSGTIQKGAVLGLIGENGSGKSTLFRSSPGRRPRRTDR